MDQASHSLSLGVANHGASSRVGKGLRNPALRVKRFLMRWIIWPLGVASGFIPAKERDASRDSLGIDTAALTVARTFEEIDAAVGLCTDYVSTRPK
jgi:hypothetical protein